MTTQTKRKFLTDIVFYLVIIAIVYVVCKFLIGYLLPFVIGIVISFLVQRPVKSICKKIKIPKGPLTVVFVVGTYLIIVGLLVLLAYGVYNWLANFVNILPGIIPDLEKIFDELSLTITGTLNHLPKAVTEYVNSLPDKLIETIANLGTPLSEWALSVAQKIPTFIVTVIVTIVASCYIAYDYDKIILFAKKLIPRNAWLIILDVKDIFFTNIFKMLKGYVLLMLITFVELTAGFFIIGQKNAMLLAAVISVIDILPVLGTGAVVIPWAIISLLTGNIWKGIGLLLIYIIVTIVRNFLEPKVIGNQVGLHPLITLLSMFCGLQLLGVVGLFGFPITLIVLNHLRMRGRLNLKIGNYQIGSKAESPSDSQNKNGNSK